MPELPTNSDSPPMGDSVHRLVLPCPNHLTTMEIITSSLCEERYQWRFPTTKKRRIRKKWALRPANFRTRPTAYKMGGKLICHPVIAEKLRAQFGQNK